MTHQLIAGNWKMNGDLATNETLVQALLAGLQSAACDVALCVPAAYLAQAKALCASSRIAVGAQDVSAIRQALLPGKYRPPCCVNSVCATRS